jgi:hypothetical protein
MKTTIDIPDPLLDRARRLADGRGTTLRALVEEGLRLVLNKSSATGEFRLRRAAFKGRGLAPEVTDASWAELRRIAYEGRGG